VAHETHPEIAKNYLFLPSFTLAAVLSWISFILAEWSHAQAVTPTDTPKCVIACVRMQSFISMFESASASFCFVFTGLRF